MSTGTKSNETNTAATVPEIRATPSPPKIGSLASRADPKIMATAVNKIGLALVAEASAMARFFSIPLSLIRPIA